MINDIYVIAELGINHNGSIDITKQLIDAAVAAGCDAVKFQKRTIDLVYTKAELDVSRESPWGTTNREQKLGLEFGQDQYEQIDAYCKKKKIAWFASCWDEQSVEFIEQFDTPYHKVASALLTNESFLMKLKKTCRPTILSTGMSTEDQIMKAARVLGASLHTVMHCTSTYPTKPEEMNVSYIRNLKWQLDNEFEPGTVNVGFSNHYSGILWVPLVVAMGATMLEFHLTLDRTMYGSDQAASIEPDGLRKLVDSIEVSTTMLGDGIKRVYDSEIAIAKKLRKVTDW